MFEAEEHIKTCGEEEEEEVEEEVYQCGECDLILSNYESMQVYWRAYCVPLAHRSFTLILKTILNFS